MLISKLKDFLKLKFPFIKIHLFGLVLPDFKINILSPTVLLIFRILDFSGKKVAGVNGR